MRSVNGIIAVNEFGPQLTRVYPHVSARTHVV